MGCWFRGPLFLLDLRFHRFDIVHVGGGRLGRLLRLSRSRIVLPMRRVMDEESIVLEDIESGERVFIDDGLAKSWLSMSGLFLRQIGFGGDKSIDSGLLRRRSFRIYDELSRIGGRFQSFQRRDFEIRERQIESGLDLADRGARFEALNRARLD